MHKHVAGLSRSNSAYESNVYYNLVGHTKPTTLETISSSSITLANLAQIANHQLAYGISPWVLCTPKPIFFPFKK